jgi:hypothetical protein
MTETGSSHPCAWALLHCLDTVQLLQKTRVNSAKGQKARIFDLKLAFTRLEGPQNTTTVSRSMEQDQTSIHYCIACNVNCSAPIMQFKAIMRRWFPFLQRDPKIPQTCCFPEELQKLNSILLFLRHMVI